MKATIIIQARMDSTRLPQKVMMKILGKPLIELQIERLKHCKNVDKIIVATSKNKSNDILCEFLNKIGIPIYVGDEEDVLKRYYFAAKKINAKNIVRLTADCPLIDPVIVDTYIQTFFNQNLDYIYPDLSFAEGLDTEVFTFQALEIAYNCAKRESEREHVTQYFHNNKEKFKTLRLKNISNDSKYRITVDEAEDFYVVKRIFKALYKEQNYPFGFNEIKNYLINNPKIYEVNTSIIRNEGLQISLNKEPKI